MITIIGAGFSGLNLAHFLTQRGARVRVVEKQATAGGLLGSPATPYGPIERAALTTINTAAFEEVCEAARVPLVKIDPEKAAKRFIYRDRPRPFPITSLETLDLARRLIPALLTKAIQPQPQETLKAWGERCLGPGATRYILEPFFQGVYAGDSSRLSATLLIGGILNTMQRKPRPPKPRLRGTVAPADGLGSMMAGLQATLTERGVTFSFGEDAVLPDNLDHPHVICSGLASLPTVLGERRAQHLPTTLETVPLVSVSLIYPKDEPTGLEGFGCLFPRGEGVTTLGALMMSNLFPARHPDWHVETFLMGGAFNPGICDWSDEQILAAARRDRIRLTGQDVPFTDHMIHRWPQALPHYTLDLERFLTEGMPHEPNLYAFGNWLGTVGLSRVSERAQMLAERLA